MKGLWLVENVYRDLKARHSGDIDLLVRPEDMPRCTRLVRTLGFKVPGDIGDVREITAANQEFSLFNPATGTGFDLHCSLTHLREEAPVDDDRFRQGPKSSPLETSPAGARAWKITCCSVASMPPCTIVFNTSGRAHCWISPGSLWSGDAPRQAELERSSFIAAWLRQA